ncbi:hypothetical protein NX059_010726 [Plenodomus lindquistii]|nr:hypothetical protein NX059_010726 [Plenodomus lindquistii]
MVHRAHRGWVQQELKPFLNKVFANHPRTQTWNDMIAQAEGDMDSDTFGDRYPAEFESTIDVLRLLLVNPDLLDVKDDDDDSGDSDEDEDRKIFEDLLKSGKIQDVVTIFVRHAVNYGTYNLAAHGTDPCRDSPHGHDMERLLPHGANFDHIVVTEVEGVIPEGPPRRRHNRRNRGRNQNGGQCGQQHPVGNGGNFHEPPQPQAQQPQQFPQQVHQSFHQYILNGSQHLQQYGQQYGQQAPQRPPPYGQHGFTFGHGVYQPITPQGGLHNTTQQMQQPLHHSPLTNVDAGPSGVFHGPAFGGSRGSFYYTNDRSAAAPLNAYQLALNGNAPEFAPQQGYQYGNGNAPAYNPQQGQHGNGYGNTPAFVPQQGGYPNVNGNAHAFYPQGQYHNDSGNAPSFVPQQGGYANGYGNVPVFVPQQYGTPSGGQNAAANNPQQGFQNGNA